MRLAASVFPFPIKQGVIMMNGVSISWIFGDC